MAHQGQAQEALVSQQPLGDFRVREAEIGKACVTGRPAVRVQHGARAEAISEPTQLAGRHRLPTQVNEVDREAALLEETHGRPGRLVVLEAEDLDGGRGRLGHDRIVAGPPAVPSHHEEFDVTVWFTVKLDDKPGSLARVAGALGDRGVNITGIVGVAEDTDGALMLTTSDAAATRAAFAGLSLAFEEHDPTGGLDPDQISVADLRPSPGG